MKELFIIFDTLSDNNQVLEYILTDNAKKCEDIFHEIDFREVENDMRCFDDKLSEFFDECKKQGIVAETPTYYERYNY